MSESAVANEGPLPWHVCGDNLVCAYTLNPIVCTLVLAGMCVLCDTFMVPAVEVLCEKKQIPPGVAGATLVAITCSMPELLVNAAATRRGSIQLSLSAIIGSALVAFALIPGCCALAAGSRDRINHVLSLSTRATLRDTVSFAVALSMLFTFLEDGKVSLLECIALLVAFVLHMVAVMLPWLAPMRCKCCSDVETIQAGDAASQDYSVIRSVQESEDDCGHHVEGHWQVHSPDRYQDDAVDQTQIRPSSDKMDASHTTEHDSNSLVCCKTLMSALAAPWRALFGMLLPNPEESPHLYGISFLLSVVWLSLLTELLLAVTEEMAAALGIAHELAGVTLLALGTSMPDLIASVVLTQHRLEGAAMSNALPSQVVNITLGIGLPFLVYVLASGKPVSVSGADIHSTMLALGIAVVAFLSCTFLGRGVRALCTCSVAATIGQGGGAALVLLYVALNVYLVLDLQPSTP